jgi:L-aminoadipate-semialdehyde dehydrogenase
MSLFSAYNLSTMYEITDDSARMPLYHFVTGYLPQNTKAPELDDSNTATALRADAEWTGEDVSTGTGVTEDVLGIYLSYLVAIGFMPSPQASGKAKSLRQTVLSKVQQDALSKIGGRGGAETVAARSVPSA